MSRVRRNPGKMRRARWLAAALTVAAIALAACGGGDGDEGDAAGTTAAPTSTGGGGTDGDPILIKTRVTFLPPGGEIGARGEILDGSTMGDSPFCPGGTLSDRHGSEDPTKEPYGLVDRTYVCPDGTLRMGFTPGVPVGNTQSGPWTIVSGTGAFEGLQGNGEMEVKYDRDNDTKGRETFTGTVTQ